MSLRELVFPLLLCVLAFLCFDRLEVQRDSALLQRDQALEERDLLIKHANTMAERLAKATANDLKHTQELADARQKNLDRRRDVDAGDHRLFVKAACPTTVPADAGAGSLADAGAAELSADARPDYFTLLDQLAVSRQMILGLQDHARLCQR